jgi:hypothetical protein
MDRQETQVNDTANILHDLIDGDISLLTREELKNFDFEKIKIALDYLVNQPDLSEDKKAYFIQNSWKIFYKRKPPTPTEFMTEKWIGPMSDHVYPRVKDTFLNFMDPTKAYRTLILYPHMGWGKSYLAMFMSLFIDTHISLMRNAKKYLGLNPASPIARAFVSFSIDKVQETLLEPFILALENGPIFEKVHTRDSMAKKERDQLLSGNIEKIYWTTSSPTSAIQFANGPQIKIVSSLHRLLGLNLIGGAVTELTHFRDAGKDDDYIMDLYSELKSRVHVRTMKGNYWGRVILDSSPDDISGGVDQYINGLAKEDSANYIIRGSVWEWDPKRFEDQEKFPMFIGGAGKPPKIIEGFENQYEPVSVIEVPEELKSSFKYNPVKALRDLAGLPSGNQARLFTSYDAIEEAMTDKLENVYTFITAPAKDDPRHLIFNQIKKQFFKNTGIKTRFYYKPYLPRVIHIDQSYVSDFSCISAVHVEKDEKTGETMYITDFTVTIVPQGGKISLDAIKFFIEDLRDLGGMIIQQISFDQFQSESSVQYLEGRGFNVTKISVDRTTDPYFFLYSVIESGKFKMGKNIIFKNNLKALELVRRDRSGTQKVDHTNGSIPDPFGNSDWETSIIGNNGKDVSDAVCGAVEAARTILAPLGVREIWTADFVTVTSEDEAANQLSRFMKSRGLVLN